MSSDVRRLLETMGAESFPYRDFKAEAPPSVTFPLTAHIAEIAASKQKYELDVAEARRDCGSDLSRDPQMCPGDPRSARGTDRASSSHVSVADILSSLRGG